MDLGGDSRSPCAARGTAGPKLPSRTPKSMPRMPKTEHPAEAGPGLLAVTPLSHRPDLLGTPKVHPLPRLQPSKPEGNSRALISLGMC